MIASYLGRLQVIFDSAQRYIPEKIEKNTSDSSLLVFVSRLQSPLDYKFNEDLYFRSQEEFLKKQLGFNYTLDALQNIDPSFQDIEDNILYQRRFQNGLEWNILKDGFFDARSELKLLPLEQEFSKELARYQFSRKNVPVKMNHLIYWFNYRKGSLLDLRLNLLNKQKEIIEALFFAKKISREFVIGNQTRIAEIEAMKHIYASYNAYITPQFDSTAYAWEAPLFDLNYGLLVGDVKENSRLDSLTKEMVGRMEEQNRWFNEIRLKAYVRHSYYDLLTADPASRAFFSVGFGATVPLNFSYREQNAIERGKLYKQLESVHLAEDNQRIDLLNEAYEYRYQLKQYIVFHQKRISLLESIRQERVKAKLQDEDFNPLHALELMDDLYQVEIELLDLKQSLYLRLMKIHEKVQQWEIGSLVVPLKLPNYFDFEDKTQRNVYIWSSAFEKHSNDFLVEYILYNQFDEVQLAISPQDAYKEKKTQLIRDLHAKGVKVDLMIGQNSLLDSQQFKLDIELMLKQYPLGMVNGAHLDIEPHTRKDWDSKQEELKNAYKYLLKETKTLCNTYNLKLSIDLPLNLDTVYVRELMEVTDVVRFMCYENIKEEYLLRKLKPFLVQKDKIAIALRAEDFDTRNDMEFFARKLSESTGCGILNFHDLNRLIELDKKSLKTDEEH